MIEEVRRLGFEYAELGHGLPVTLMEGVRQAVAAGEIRISSLHNFCPLPPGVRGPSPDVYSPSSLREPERALAVRYTLQTIEYAAQLGAGAVVLHLGAVRMRRYTRKLLSLCRAGHMETPRFCRRMERALAKRQRKRDRHWEQVLRFLEAVVSRARDLHVALGLETRFSMEEIPDEAELGQLVGQFGNGDVGYWHDVGHAQVRENLGLMSHEIVLERFRGRTLGIHLQDVAWPDVDHLPPGRGEFCFERLRKYVTPEMVLAWEIHPQFEAGVIADGMKRVQALLDQRETI